MRDTNPGRPDGPPAGRRAETPSRQVARLLPLAAIAAALVLAYAMGWESYLTLDQIGRCRDVLKQLVAERPVPTAMLFVVVYFLGAATALPACAALTVVGGFLFGWIPAVLLVEIGAVSGAGALFLASRTAFGESLRGRIGPRADRLASGFERGAFGYLLVLRLAPFLPFFLINIASALFRVRLSTFLSATAIGILPGVLAYAYLGRGLDSALAAAGAAGRQASLRDLVTPEITLAFVGLAAVALTAMIIKKMMRARAA